WKNSSRRKPLIVRGARQVGKTWSIERFGGLEFDDIAKIDFEKRPDLGPLFDGDLSPLKLLDQLELTIGRKIHRGKTLLFFDEIQACPRAVTALRYFYEETPELHVIAAGSLLEFALGEIAVPVGRVSYMDMYPMTFQEYLIAMGNEPAADIVVQQPTALAEPIHQMLLDALKRYFFVGGLPECVSIAVSGGSMLDVFAVQDDILSAYRDDFAKYGGRSDKTCLDAVMVHVARQVGRQIKYTRLGDTHSGQTNRKAFALLCMAWVLHKIPSSRPAALPLGASANEKRFKAAFLDVGLMQRLCGLPVDREMQHRDLLDIYRGQLAEQFVAQELLVTHRRELFYWSREARGSQAEVDFLAVQDGRIHPVEVKSGSGGQLRSLHLALQTYPSCGEGLVLYSGPYGDRPEQRLRFIPLYYAGIVGPNPARRKNQEQSTRNS
ncbi:MAG: ATP-binding protein, partial [Deltaproteobacteria bacterium]|nr:ATP-binding protein [Deltaproteobacteria bacterium]